MPLTATDLRQASDEAIAAEFLRARDQDFFRALVERYQTRVFQLALSVLGVGFRGEAEEVAQEVFLTVAQRLASFRGDSKLSTWIYRITYNAAVDLKTTARYRLPHEPDALEHTEAKQTPFGSAVMAEQQAVLRACIAGLPVQYQAALNLHYWFGYSVDEIAGQLDVPAGTVKSYLHRSRTLLAQALQQRGFKP